MDPKPGQAVRVVYTGESLLEDRKSLLYLSVLDIPAKPEAKEDSDNSEQRNSNYLRLVIRSRTKFFSCPAHLKLTPSDTCLKVTWRQEEGRIKVVDPVPYYVAYNKIAADQNEHLTPIEYGGMILPFSSAILTLKGRTMPASKVSWAIVNDYGGYQ